MQVHVCDVADVSLILLCDQNVVRVSTAVLFQHVAKLDHDYCLLSCLVAVLGQHASK